MTFRPVSWAIVCGLCALCAVDMPALAATALNDVTQSEVNQGTIRLERNPEAAAPARVPSGNPLWAIPLGTLAITRERPIFSPSRRPPAPAVIAPPRIAQPKIITPPAEPEHPNLVLVGTVVGESEGFGVFLDQTTHNVVRLKTGEGHAGWILRSVKAREATLQKERQTETLRLPAPGEQRVPAPAQNIPGVQKKEEQL